MKYRLTILMVVTVLFTSTHSCKKISTPNEDSKLLFGSWQYKGSSGGFSGTGLTTMNEKNYIEFTERGYCKVYEGTKCKYKKRFTLEVKESITGYLRSTIIYKGTSSINQSFEIYGDTLFLNDEVYDGYNYIYIKK